MFVGGGLSIGDLLDSSFGNGYSVRVGVFYAAPGADNGFETRGVVGAETQDAMIAMLRNSSTVATYTGFADIEVRQTDAGFNTFNANLSGDLTMTADFGARRVSGSIGNLSYEERAGQVVTSTATPAGSIVVNDAIIQDNAFAGTMSADATLAGAAPDEATFVDSLEYSGAFYGPAAEEVGGTIQGGANVGGTDYIGIGNFRGN